MKPLTVGIAALFVAFGVGVMAGETSPDPPKLHHQCKEALEYGKDLDGIVGYHLLEYQDMIKACYNSYKEQGG